MSTLHTLDPYLAHYVYEKQKDPNAPIVWRQYEKRIVDTVDHIVEMAQGIRETVTSLKDWEIVGQLLKLFAEEWPQEFADFKKSMQDIRGSRRADGYSETREIRFVGSFPPRFGRLIKAIFPSQQFDKKFVNKLVKKFPVFRVGGEGNLSKGRILV